MNEKTGLAFHSSLIIPRSSFNENFAAARVVSLRGQAGSRQIQIVKSSGRPRLQKLSGGPPPEGGR
jgi:hypothetical protein